MRILIIDDEPDIRYSTSLLLEHFGHAVSAAEGGAAALEIVKTEPPDAILLDLSMPGMDGFETARRLRKTPAAASALIVAVSAYVSDKAWCDRAIAAGVDECLGKPMDYDKLAKMLAARAGRNG